MFVVVCFFKETKPVEKHFKLTIQAKKISNFMPFKNPIFSASVYVEHVSVLFWIYCFHMGLILQ